jgi:hypothetical protein
MWWRPLLALAESSHLNDDSNGYTDEGLFVVLGLRGREPTFFVQVDR